MSVNVMYGQEYGPLPFLEASSQTFKVGDLLQYCLTTTDQGSMKIASIGRIDGIAAKKATGTAATALSYYPICFDKDYVVPSYTTTAVTNIGTTYSFVWTAGGQTLAAKTTSAASAYCVALDPRDAVGTDGGRLIVRFLIAPTCAS